MARKLQKEMPQLGRLQRVASAVKRLFSRGEEAPESRSAVAAAEVPARAPKVTAQKAGSGRTTRRETDIPMDVISDHYTPPFTGGKAGFRSDGADHQNDQEFAYGVSDERWNDEDRLTNKSGDPRIGTHRRTYEPGETRTESRD
jgi:hypothetical protein